MDSTVNKDYLAQLELMGISQSDAIQCLKACNNDPNQAAEYYWNGDLDKAKEQNKWDEAAWSTPREGTTDTHNQAGTHVYSTDYAPPSFKIQGSDALSPSIFEGTKSRPPSRISMNRTDEDDPGLAKAIEESMQVAHGNIKYSRQESGITGTHTSPTHPSFAPTQQNKEYIPHEWALTTTRAQEVALEPLPHDRKRNPTCPAFLRPDSTGYNIAGALTIFHSIPSARNAFLFQNRVLPNYGHGDKWWNGEKIRVSRVIDLENERPWVAKSEEMISEWQRLMAFLDQTDRAYGSVDTLVNVLKTEEYRDEMTPFGSHLTSWMYALMYDQDEPSKNILEYPGPPFKSVATDLSEGKSQHQHFYVLETSATLDDQNLYSAIDGVVWADENSDVVIEFSDVVCIQVKPEQDVNSIGIEVPFDLYLDRYTKPWLEKSKELRAEIRAQRSHIIELEARVQRLTNFRPRNIWEDNATTYDPKTLLQITIEHFSTPLTRSSENPDDVIMDSQPEKLDPTPVLKELLDKLESKLSNLLSLQHEAQESLQKLRYKYTSSNEIPDSLTMTRYSLRGVLLNSAETYILCPNETSEDDVGMEDSGDLSEQWWRITWEKSSDTSAPHRVSPDEVLSAVRTGGDRIILIYANEKALQTKPAPLSGPLQEFVTRDNTAFTAELGHSSPERKRRHSSWLEGELEDRVSIEDNQGSPKRASPRGGSSTHGSPGKEGAWETTTEKGDPDDDNIVTQTVYLPAQQEMEERGGHVSPVAKAFHLDMGKVPGSDDDMTDVQHVEKAEERKGG
ncbi:hypothetical protein EDC01DRAFT_657928 [Geopyxis carbonaria]|nr:hypothetical protein EDC01DRAFT_657928 [Geopyxis carbonaria]